MPTRRATFLLRKTKASGVKPVLQALVLAERVYGDRSSGKKVIAGTFNRIGITNTPIVQNREAADGKRVQTIAGGLQPGSPFVYISLTDVCDNTPLTLQFVSLTRNRVFFSTNITVSCQDRLATVEITAGLPELRVPEPGVYALELVCENEVIGSHRIVAEIVGSQDKDQA